MEDDRPSDIRFKLNEAHYFLEQMKKNTGADNSAYFYL